MLFAPGRRTLGVLVRSLPSKMWPALGRWHGDGAWGRYFDNPADGDDLNFEDWQVIDMAGGGGARRPVRSGPVLPPGTVTRLALENPDETARVKLMVVDEAWRYLQDPAVLSYLAEAAKTWRKKNAALVIATQSAVDVTGTAGAEALLESMPTQAIPCQPGVAGKGRRNLPAQSFRSQHHSRLDSQTGALPTPPRRGWPSYGSKSIRPVIGSTPRRRSMLRSGPKQSKSTASPKPLNTYLGGRSC